MLTTQQLATLEAVVDRIIPPDDFPGGWEAGVGTYLLHNHDLASQGFSAEYAPWFDALDAEAQSRYQAAFAQLSASDQDALLASIERGKVRTAWPVDAAQVFAALVEQCAEGFYSDPGNGGNHDGVSWRMIRFEVRG